MQLQNIKMAAVKRNLQNSGESLKLNNQTENLEGYQNPENAKHGKTSEIANSSRQKDSLDFFSYYLFYPCLGLCALWVGYSFFIIGQHVAELKR